MNKSLLSVLRLLSDGEFHSGERIGEALDVSRSAVWKHLQKLSSLGLSVQSVKGKGYCLPGGLDMLDDELIYSGLNHVTINKLERCDVFDQVESTNVSAVGFPLASSQKGYACFAEYQRAGKGRRGRQWVSPYGYNIYLSIAWQFEEGAARLEGLSLAVGVVIAQVLQQAGIQGVQLKWPNDILLQQRKLGGVLLEMSGDPSDICKVVVGVGLNVRMPEEVSIDQPWAALAQQQPTVSRNALAAGLLNGLVPMLSDFHSIGFEKYIKQWQNLDAYRGSNVRVSSGQRVVEGVAEGVFANGALRLRVDDEERAIYGGEVSLRPVYAP